jgi:hypothetical protein
LRFVNPYSDKEFEIPDEWLEDVNLRAWLGQARTDRSYRVRKPPYPIDPQDLAIPQVEATIEPLDAIRPFDRNLSTGMPFETKEQLLRILIGFKSGDLLPPAHVIEASPGPYRFTLYHGAHRYYASLAARFSHIPVVVSPRIKN